MRYQAKVEPMEMLLRMLVQTSHFESSQSDSRGGLFNSWALSPSLGSPGTNPGPIRHCALSFLRSSALFRFNSTLGMLSSPAFSSSHSMVAFHHLRETFG